MTNLATDLRNCADNVEDEYPGAASVMRRAADHLASSGPAGEIASNVLESLKAKDDLIRKLESEVAKGEEDYNFSIKQHNETHEYLAGVAVERDTARQECEAQKARAMRAEGERDALAAQLEKTISEPSTGYEVAASWRDMFHAAKKLLEMTQVELEEAIAQGSHNLDLREADGRIYLAVANQRDAAVAENERLREALERVVDFNPNTPDWKIHIGMRNIARQALTPAPDHAKGEE